eukprot:scaffold22696_cov69-Phaeocystis_antarctica.AAC.1
MLHGGTARAQAIARPLEQAAVARGVHGRAPPAGADREEMGQRPAADGSSHSHAHRTRGH